MAEERSGFTVIVENDESQWDDDTGVRYHYPKRYRRFVAPGTRLIHYKGRMRDQKYAASRLSPEPHYFAVSTAGQSTPDPSSSKGDLFVSIDDFEQFPVAVPIRVDGRTLEVIPATRVNNFWRDGVRPTTEAIANRVISLSGLALGDSRTASSAAGSNDGLTSVLIEGGKRSVYSTQYERKPALRAKAIAIHGAQCFACEMEFGKVYGKFAANFIHVHHKRPLSEAGGPTPVDPRTDLAPLCPNCHAVVHLNGQLRTINDVRAMLGKSAIPLGE